MKKKVVVVGKKDMATGFSLAGVDETYVPADDYETEKRLEKLLESSDVGVILLSESLAEEVREELKKLKNKKKDSLYPLIIEIPDKEGAMEKREDPLQEKIKRAVGVDITTEDK